MTIAQQIYKRIEKMADGVTFKYSELGVDPEQYEAAIKALVRLQEKGVINRMAKGLYYKPKQSLFGELQPSDEELLRPYLFDGKKRFAYITGISLYNRMGLTTQVAHVIKVASRGRRVITKIGNIEIKAVKSYVDVTNDNVSYLEFLDALKDFKSIPDLDRKMAIRLLEDRLEEFIDRKKLIKIALEYPSRVRAFLGALLCVVKSDEKNVTKLRDSLNYVTIYKLGLNEELLRGSSLWRIQ